MPQLDRRQAVEIPDRVAQMIEERRKPEPPPPAPVVEEPVAEPEPEPAPEPAPEPEPEPEPEPAPEPARKPRAPGCWRSATSSRTCAADRTRCATSTRAA